MTNWLAIVNPRSNGGQTLALLPSIMDRMQRLAEKTVVTEYPGHAAELARNASGEGADSTDMAALSLAAHRLQYLMDRRRTDLRKGVVTREVA